MLGLLTFSGTLSLPAAAQGTPQAPTPPLALTPLYPFTALDGSGCNLDGAYPSAALTVGTDGALYGTTSGGGAGGEGTVFKVNPDGTGYTVLHAFTPLIARTNADGSAPTGTLLDGGDGFLYGTAYAGGQSGGGTVFKIGKDGTGFAVLHAFYGTDNGNNHGGFPAAGLTQGADGALYGMTSGGDTGQVSLIYKINPDGTGYTVLYSFFGNDSPMGALLIGGDGLLYGTTLTGGDYGAGSIFKIALDGTGFATLYSFTAGADGGYPQAGLTWGGDGFLYGTTSDSQTSSSNGGVFKIKPDGTGFLTLYSFSGGSDGGSPYAPLALGTDGRLYGTTFGGGASSAGTVFAINRDGTGFVTLASLSGSGSDGGGPTAGLTPGPQGQWFGTALDEGLNGSGAVFALAYPAPAQTPVQTQTPPVQVQTPPAPTITSITITAASPYTMAGITDQFTAAAAYSNGTSADVSSAVTWASDSAATATINSHGLANAVAAGTANITATLGSVTSNSVSLTVNAAVTVVAAATPVVHILWDSPDGQAQIWAVNTDGSHTLVGTYGPYDDTGDVGVPGNAAVWHATALATAPDGTIHLLWNHPDGRVMLWTVDAQGGFTLAGYGPYTDAANTGVPGNTALWHANALAIAPDGTVRILWDHPDGRAMLWNVDASFNFTLLGYGPYDDTGDVGVPGNAAVWHATALATAPDGTIHLLWNHPDGRVMLWTVDAQGGFTLAGYGPYTDAANTGVPGNTALWHSTSVAAGPDGKVHLLWNHPDGRVMVWDMDEQNGLQRYTGYGPYTDTPNVGVPGNTALWHAAALAITAANMPFVLWGHPDGQTILWGLAPDASFGFAGIFPPTIDSANNLWAPISLSGG